MIPESLATPESGRPLRLTLHERPRPTRANDRRKLHVDARNHEAFGIAVRDRDFDPLDREAFTLSNLSKIGVKDANDLEHLERSALLQVPHASWTPAWTKSIKTGSGGGDHRYR